MKRIFLIFSLTLFFFFIFSLAFLPQVNKSFAVEATNCPNAEEKCIIGNGCPSTYTDTGHYCNDGSYRGYCCIPSNTIQNDVAPPPPPCDTPLVSGECKTFSTALGPVTVSAGGLVQKLFGIILGISGSIAVILIIISGYRLMASQGNPEQVKGAQEQLTAAIIGLLFIIFSLLILQFIGVDVLGIFGASSGGAGGGAKVR